MIIGKGAGYAGPDRCFAPLILTDTAPRQQPPDRLACQGAHTPYAGELTPTRDCKEAGTTTMSTTVTIRPDPIAVDRSHGGN